MSCDVDRLECSSRVSEPDDEELGVAVVGLLCLVIICDHVLRMAVDAVCALVGQVNGGRDVLGLAFLRCPTHPRADQSKESDH